MSASLIMSVLSPIAGDTLPSIERVDHRQPTNGRTDGRTYGRDTTCIMDEQRLQRRTDDDRGRADEARRATGVVSETGRDFIEKAPMRSAGVTAMALALDNWT